MDDTLQIKSGEKKRVGKTITHKDDSAVGIDTATFIVRDVDATATQASGNATIAGDDTASPDVYGFVDTTTGTWTVGSHYRVIFTVTFDDGEIGIYDRPIEIITA